MNVIAAMIMFIAVVAAMVIIIVSDNKHRNDGNKRTKKNSEPERWVYDGAPLTRCSRCNGHAVIVGFKKPNEHPDWYIRCKDCDYTNGVTNKDLGLVMNQWHVSNAINNDDSYDYYTDVDIPSGRQRKSKANKNNEMTRKRVSEILHKL